MRDKYTIAAVVVTYNRKELLTACIESLMRQTRPPDAIYLIDNASTDNTLAHLRKNKIVGLAPQNDSPADIIEVVSTYKECSVHYVQMPENTGSAGGFHEGAKRAYEYGYDWIWMMDDDCLPEHDCLKTLIENVVTPNDAYLPYVMDYAKKHALFSDIKINSGLHVLKEGPFNGFLISGKLINSIGFPIKEFFIYKDDFEYTFRIEDNGGKLVLISDALLLHPNRTFSFIGLSKSAFNPTVIYYGLRNTIWMCRKHNRRLSFRSRFRYTLVFLAYIFTLRWDLLKTMLKAVKDGCKGNLGQQDIL
jgi:rhamnopyranosyl-N-acetylglucosaminyl-diphospho-decaprenol beta-1,3/1,4-galactofuranosyltransferase